MAKKVYKLPVPVPVKGIENKTNLGKKAEVFLKYATMGAVVGASVVGWADM